RAVLHGLWMLYAASNRQVRADVRRVSFQLSLKVSSATLEKLETAGFLRLVASKPLASRARSREVEKEKEQTKPQTPRLSRPDDELKTLEEEVQQWTRGQPHTSKR